MHFLHGLGIENIAARVSALGTYLIEELDKIGCRVLTPIDPAMRHGLIVYTNGSLEKDREVVAALRSVKPKPVKVGACSLGGVEGIRVATNFFNTREDIDVLIDAQKAFFKQGS